MSDLLERLWPVQAETVEATVARRRIVLAAQPGCIQGDADMIVNRAGKSFHITLAELVHAFNGGERGRWGKGHAWRADIPTKVQHEAADGTLRLTPIVAAWASGTKQTYTVTTGSGRQIRATDEHPFRTERGWLRLDQLMPGDRVHVRGQQGTGLREPKALYREVSGLIHHPHARGANRRTSPHRVAQHRLVAEAALNNLDYRVYLSRVKAGDIRGLRFLDPKKYAVHHINLNPQANWPGNLRVMTHSAHHRLHAELGKTASVLYKVATEKVTSIEPYGVEETFDIEVESPEHNFLANGFVVHNTGKTPMAITALEGVGAFDEGVSLVLAPKDPCKLTWAPHFANWAPNVPVINCYSGTGAQKADRIRSIIPGSIVIANHDALGVAKSGKETVPGLSRIPFRHVVIDEAHEILPLSTDNTSEFTQVWRGLARVRAQLEDDALMLLMSGTPWRGKDENRYGYRKFHWPSAHKDFWAWARDNFDIEQQKIRRYDPRTNQYIERRVPAIGGVSSEARTRLLAMDGIQVIRRTKDEIRAGRPKMQHVPVMLDLEPEQIKALDKYDELTWEGKNDDTPAVWAIRSRQLAGIGQWNVEDGHATPLDGAPSTKYVYLREWLRTRGYFDPEFVIDPEKPSKVVLDFAFNETLEWVKRALLADGLVGEIGTINGQGGANQNYDAQKRFQEFGSPMRVMLLQQDSGRGIDLDAADDMILFDIPYGPDVLEQNTDRIDRLSRDHRTTIWWFIGKGTIDAAIALKNQERFEATRELLDGSRGLEYRREMLGKIKKEARHVDA